ncbi:MAG: hypothetical protein WAW36_18865 [Methylovulum miyakonense]|uniref:hypothetical protein n=1 Tax=Methylovulum miyakonense TaxID=645578 RepID=UPI003BB6F05F
MIIKMSDALRNARAQAIVNAINNGTGAGAMLFYTAPMPGAGGDAISTQTLLGTLTFDEPAGSVATGVLTFSAPSDDASADADGNAAWVRILDGDGAWVMDMDVTLNSGDGAIRMPSVGVYQGGVLRVTGGTLMEGNAA